EICLIERALEAYAGGIVDQLDGDWLDQGGEVEIVEIIALAFHQALGSVLRVALEDDLVNAVCASGAVLVLVALGGDRLPLHRVGGDGIVRYQGVGGADVYAQRILG